jgi:hypothetical protein
MYICTRSAMGTGQIVQRNSHFPRAVASDPTPGVQPREGPSPSVTSMFEGASGRLPAAL